MDRPQRGQFGFVARAATLRCATLRSRLGLVADSFEGGSALLWVGLPTYPALRGLFT